MADNVAITAGSGTSIATDDVSGVHYQIVKLDVGGDGASSPVSGSVPVSATDLDVRDLTATDVVTVTGGAGQTADVKVTLDSESVAVTGTFWQTTQPVSIASAVPVTDNSGSLTVDATALDIRALSQSTDTVKIGDGTSVIDVDVAPTDGETNGGKRLLHTEAWLWGYNGSSWDRLRSDTTNGLDVDVTRVSGTVTVSATDLDIRNLSQAQDSVAIGDGTDIVAVSTAAADGESNTVNRLEVEAYAMAYNGSTWDRVRGNSTGGFFVQGNNTNDSPVAGNPVYIGGRAATTPQTDVSADGDFVPARFDRHGCLFVEVHTGLPAGANTIGTTNTTEALADDAAFTPATSKVFPAGCMADDSSTDNVDEGDVGVVRMTLDRRMRVEVGNYTLAANNTSTGTGNTQIVAAPGAGVSIYVTSICGYNSSNTDTYVNILDGTTTKLILPLAGKGGFTMSFPAPLKISANAALQFACPGGVSSSYVSAVYYTAPG